MPPRLVPLSPGRTAPIPLQRPVLLIGRHPECDIRLDLPQVSRRHCCIATAYDRLTIRDLGSRHGVRVNGRKIEEARLLPGDEVAIAQLLFRLEDSGIATPARRPPGPGPSPGPDPDPTPDLTPDPPSGEPEIELVPLDDP